jgi:ABC-type Fe3+-siderophore transport system permease subunit
LLFLLFSDALLGFGTGSMIQDAQWPSLMIIYSLGFLAVQCVFALLYSHAYRKRTELALNEIEIFLTWRSILSHLLLAGVGLTSILIAAFGGLNYVSWSSWIYLLIIPLQVLLTHFLRRRKIAAYQTAEHIH